MKKIVSIILASTIAFGAFTPIYASDGVKIKVEGKEITDAQAILQNGATLLPVRSVSTALGGDVVWDAETKTVVVTKGETKVVLPVGEKYIIVNEDMIDTPSPAQVVNGKTYVPLRVLGNALSCEITWVKETKTVEIKTGKQTEELEKGNKDLFEGQKDDTPYFLTDGVYLTEGEIVPVPVVGGNWISWSNRSVVDCEWGWYNGQKVVFITGLKTGMVSMQIYESESAKGLIEDGYTEIKVRVVGENNDSYRKQKEQRIADGFDILANQAEVIAREDAVRESYGLQLLGIEDTNYITKDDVLIIPITSKEPLTGDIFLYANEEAKLRVVMDQYDGKPAIFIKGDEWARTSLILEYINSGSDTLNFTFTQVDFDPSLFWTRDSLRNDTEASNVDSARWEFDLRVVNGTGKEYKDQKERRILQGISYDLYLNGKA